MWRMKTNPSKTHSITISKSKTSHSPFTFYGLDLEVSNTLKLLRVTIDNKLTFEKHICNIASSTTQNYGLIRKCYKTLGNKDAVLKSFYAFFLPCFKYCSTVWCSASDSHLKLLDCALNNTRFFILDILINLNKHRIIVCLSMLHKIFHNANHSLHYKLLQFAKPIRSALILLIIGLV